MASFVTQPAPVPRAGWPALQFLGLPLLCQRLAPVEAERNAECIIRAVATFPSLRKLMLGQDQKDANAMSDEAHERLGRFAADLGATFDIDFRIQWGWSQFDWQSEFM